MRERMADVPYVFCQHGGVSLRADTVQTLVNGHDVCPVVRPMLGKHHIPRITVITGRQRYSVDVVEEEVHHAAKERGGKEGRRKGGTEERRKGRKGRKYAPI